jgi:hypothetical protein
VIVRWESSGGHSGSEAHGPVILPPSRAGGVRCSVKPASRAPLHSLGPSQPGLSPEPLRSATRLGTGGPTISGSEPTAGNEHNVRITLPPLGLQALATELGEGEIEECLYN